MRTTFQWKGTILMIGYLVEAHRTLQTTRSSGPIEICEWKKFNESCPTGSVIVIELALYGRMRLGGCATEDFGRQGCSVSVLSYVERRCAGRRECSLGIPDEYLGQLKTPCSKDLKTYLELSYHCVEVESGETHPSCLGIEIPVSRTAGYLSNFITEESGLGSSTCPWVIQGRPGHRFTLTLIDFAVWSTDGGVSRLPVKSGLCQIYAKIRESTESPGGGVIVCGGEHREQLVYSSETNVVRVEITDPKSGSNPAYFLLKYETTGCANYVSGSSSAVVERHSDRTLVHCPHDDLTFELRCEVDQWVGKVHNCSGDYHPHSIWNIGGMLAKTGAMSTDVVAMVIGVIAVLVALGILTTGVLFIRRRRSGRRHRRRQKLMSGESDPSSGGGVIDNKVTSDPTYIRYKEHYPMLLKPDGFASVTTRGREDEYTVTTTGPPPPPPTAVHVTFGSSRLSHHDPPSNSAPDFYCFPADGTFPLASTTTDQEEDLYSISSGANGTGNREEHIYESPKFFRRPCDEDDDDDGGGGDDSAIRQAALYHEQDHQTFTARWTPPVP